ncbi:PE family protein, partial [Mycobacterium simulans]|uniref:PE family protein n=1 Tax=Mycobacterium simulans TaxID=627089 RepID=UPI0017483199
MSFVFAAPEALADAAAGLSAINSALNAGTAAALPATTGVIAAAQDEVSLAIAALFAQHAGDYQAVARQVAAVGDQFMRNLTGAGAAYAVAEAAAAPSLQAFGEDLLAVANAQAMALLGRPLIGNGADATTPGGVGGAGGLLMG